MIGPYGPDLSGYDPIWSISTPAERAEALLAVAAQMEAWKRQDQRREERREEARQIRLIKTAKKAGLPVRRAVIEGVALEFGQAEPEKAAAPREIEIADTDINEWDLDLGIQTPSLRQ